MLILQSIVWGTIRQVVSAKSGLIRDMEGTSKHLKWQGQMAADRRPRDLSELTWTAEASYHWAKGEGEDGGVDTFLIPAPSGTLRILQGADHPSLFRQFADLEPEPEALLAFAQQFGELGLSERFIEHPHREGRGESLSSWRAEVLGMKHALRVVDALDRGHARELSAWFSVGEWGVSGMPNHYLPATYLPGGPVPRGAFQHVTTADADWSHTERISAAERNELLETYGFEILLPRGRKLSVPELTRYAARQFVQRVVTDRLVLWCSPELLSDADGFRLGLHPRGLIGVLWFQLLSALEGGYKYRRCESCVTWIEISPHARGRRQGVRFCSDTCRKRAERKRERPRKTRRRTRQQSTTH